MNNHSGSTEGQAVAVVHFLLRLPWKLPRLSYCTCRPDACCYCVWPGVVFVCVSLIIRGLLKERKQKAGFAAIHTHTHINAHSQMMPGCGTTLPNGSHTKSHTEKPSIARTHICCTECTCQSAEDKRGSDTGVFGWQTEISIQIFCKTLNPDTDSSLSVTHWPRDNSVSETN